MFILIAFLVSLVAAAAEIFFLTEKKSAKEIITALIKNIFTVTLSSIAVKKYFTHHRHFIITPKAHTDDYIRFLFISLAVACVFLLINALVKKFIVFGEPKPPKKKKGAMAVKIIAVVLFFLGMAAYTGTVWGTSAFGNVTGDQLLINLTSPTEGTEMSVYIEGFEGPVFETLLFTTFFSLLMFGRFTLIFRKNNKEKVILSEFVKRVICFILAISMFIGGITFGIVKFDLVQVFNAYVLKSDMIDKHFVDPETTEIKWPEKKRNLIFIYLESIENSYLSKDLGGNIDVNLMPNLTELAYTGTVFSDTDNYFGGPQKATGTQWSIASMVNQMTGLPMKAPGMHNAYGVEGNFLPGAYTLAEMLEAQGYEQTCMIGASGDFGGLRYFFETHGNWKFMDYNYAIEHEMIPKDYKVWWGFEDDKLYEFAKEEITRLYKTGKPFNFTMENADTHRPDGYVSKGKKKPYKSPYANAIWNSDQDVCKFVKWIQKQPFYENTTVILIGDHRSMETDFFKFYKFTKDYNRTQFNLILNPAPSVGTPDKSITNNRLWANWDMFPTTVASLGAQIDGERLGIGTNLFSGKPTLFEEYGVEKVNKELEKGSKFYNDKILQSDDFRKGTFKRIKK